MQINTSQEQNKIFYLTKLNRKSKHEKARYRNPLCNFEYACLIDEKLHVTHAQKWIANSLFKLEKNLETKLDIENNTIVNLYQ